MSRMTDEDSRYIHFIVEYYRKTQFYPSYEEIASGLNKGKATVFSHMTRLEDNGILIRKLPSSPIYRLANINLLLKGSEGKR